MLIEKFLINTVFLNILHNNLIVRRFQKRIKIGRAFVENSEFQDQTDRRRIIGNWLGRERDGHR